MFQYPPIPSDTQFRIENRIGRAKTRARSTGRPQYVCAIDDGGEFGERSIIACEQAYVDSDEFAAFDGAIIHVVSPDGSVD